MGVDYDSVMRIENTNLKENKNNTDWCHTMIVVAIFQSGFYLTKNCRTKKFFLSFLRCTILRALSIRRWEWPTMWNSTWIVFSVFWVLSFVRFHRSFSINILLFFSTILEKKNDGWKVKLRVTIHINFSCYWIEHYRWTVFKDNWSVNFD